MSDEQPDIPFATMELSRFTITGRGTVIIVPPIENRAAMQGRVVNISGARYRVVAVEDCLVLGHHAGVCSHDTGLLVEPIPEHPGG